MTNSSIYSAFERMWQHIVARIGTKADINHNHDNLYEIKGAAEIDAAALNSMIKEVLV